MNERRVSIWTLTLSVTLHAWVLSGPAEAHSARKVRSPPQIVEFTVSEPRRLSEPESIQLDPIPPSKSVTPSKTLPQAPAPSASAMNPTEASEASPRELTGTTLTGDTALGFEVPPGSGRSRRGIFRAGISAPVFDSPAEKPSRAPNLPQPSVPASVPVSKLSKLPVPPELGQALERNYPVDARKQGRSGQAKVRARVEPSGRVLTARMTSESSAGFGTACQKTLLQSVWSPPLGPQGKPVATWVNYLCKFRIDR